MAIPLNAPGQATLGGIKSGQDFMKGVEDIKSARQSRKESEQRIKQSEQQMEQSDYQFKEYKSESAETQRELERLDKSAASRLNTLTNDIRREVFEKTGKDLAETGADLQMAKNIADKDLYTNSTVYSEVNKLFTDIEMMDGDLTPERWKEFESKVEPLYGKLPDDPVKGLAAAKLMSITLPIDIKQRQELQKIEAQKTTPKTPDPWNIVGPDGGVGLSYDGGKTYIPEGESTPVPVLGGSQFFKAATQGTPDQMGISAGDARQIERQDEVAMAYNLVNKGSSVFLDPDLEQVVGRADVRGAEWLSPRFLTDKQQELRKGLESFKIEKILPIIRNFAPVTENDVKMLISTMPGAEQGAESLRKWYLDTYLPETANTIQSKWEDPQRGFDERMRFANVAIAQALEANLDVNTEGFVLNTLPTTLLLDSSSVPAGSFFDQNNRLWTPQIIKTYADHYGISPQDVVAHGQMTEY